MFWKKITHVKVTLLASVCFKNCTHLKNQLENKHAKHRRTCSSVAYTEDVRYKIWNIYFGLTDLKKIGNRNQSISIEWKYSHRKIQIQVYLLLNLRSFIIYKINRPSGDSYQLWFSYFVVFHTDHIYPFHLELRYNEAW